MTQNDEDDKDFFLDPVVIPIGKKEADQMHIQALFAHGLHLNDLLLRNGSYKLDRVRKIVDRLEWLAVKLSENDFDEKIEDFCNQVDALREEMNREQD